MPAPSVYLESSFISYLAARTSPDPIMAGHQHATHAWWQSHRSKFDLFISQIVIDEIQAGDPTAAAERLRLIDGLPVLVVNPAATLLAEMLLRSSGLPQRALADAIHVAVAATNGIDYLLTWNLRHIANAHIRPRLESVCRANNYEPAIICTPDELIGGSTDGR